MAPLNGVRAIACLIVVATHVGFLTGRSGKGDALAQVLARFDFGVTLFFLLSGFLLYRPFVAHAFGVARPSNYRRYFIHRFFRILPAYWLALILTFTLEGKKGLDLDAVIRFFTLTHIYRREAIHDLLGQMWSLDVEMSFYLVLPLLALYGAKPGPAAEVWRRNMILFCGMLATWTVWVLVMFASGLATSHPTTMIWLPANLEWFAAGMALATVLSARRVDALPHWARQGLMLVDQAPRLLLALAAMAFAIAATPIGGPIEVALPEPFEWTTKAVLYTVCAFLIMAVFVLGPQDSPEARLLGSKPMEFMGRVSYGVFLLHLLALQILMRDILGVALFDGRALEVFLLGTLLATVAAWLSWKLLEEPCMKVADKLSSRTAKPRTGG